MSSKDPSPDELRRRLDELKLAYMRDHAEELVRAAAAGQWSHTQFLARLLAQHLTQQRAE